MTETPYRPHSGRPHVVVIGSGFGGLFAAKKLQGAEVDVTLIDRTNHHLFQPLLYQVATGILSSGEIAPSTRTIFDGVQNVRVVKGDVTDIDVEKQVVTSELGHQTSKWEYDHLLVAAGAGQSYFGNEQFAEFAPGMKSVDDALEIRARVTGAFERAEITSDPEARKRLLTFVVVGAGPTGVELAGQLAEMSHRTLRDEFREIDTEDTRILLIDGGSQVLAPFGKRLGRKAARRLEDLGVEIILNSLVTDVSKEGVRYKDMKTEEEYFIPSYAKIWSAGVAASPLGKHVAEQAGIEVDRAGRVPVNDDLTLGDYHNIFIVGDMMSKDRLPGVAQVAMQGGQYAAPTILDEVNNGTSHEGRVPFNYFDKGSMAIVSRFNAVVKMNKAEVSGFMGWVMWLVLHLLYMVGFRNRAVAAFSWGLNSVSRRRWQLVATRQQLHARNALRKLRELEDKEGTRSIEVRDNLRFGEGRDTRAVSD